MRYSHIAPKYARALLNVAIELGKQEEYGQLLAFVVELYDKTKQFLDDPTQNSAKQVERIVGFLNQVGVAVDKPFWSFLKIVFEKKRQASLPAILGYYTNMKIESQMKVPVVLTIAYDLSDEETRAISDFVRRYTKREPVFDIKFDQSLLAGAVIEYNGRTFDVSISGRLRNIARSVFQKG
ncbi:MAG TPA: F0F1 ATP synthase subunit delta [Pseudothermotoga sp.]|nr:F0F1 ATP synthase subunit delta [Pseudothermotoga sp.]HOK83236.1 F0F1 ATP synthase subunit delta [Pseudothermotoga sp.]HPP70062.1 F0F1 ATP synthase subunit delta [Pseudothermotoga sp.]